MLTMRLIRQFFFVDVSGKVVPWTLYNTDRRVLTTKDVDHAHLLADELLWGSHPGLTVAMGGEGEGMLLGAIEKVLEDRLTSGEEEAEDQFLIFGARPCLSTSSASLVRSMTGEEEETDVLAHLRIASRMSAVDVSAEGCSCD